MLGKLRNYTTRSSIFLITVALVAGMAGCFSSPQSVEIRTWHDLDAIRNDLSGHHRLMNNLNSTTDGYEELASDTANQGQGWQPIGTPANPFTGTFDGQGYEVRNLFINRPAERDVALFGAVAEVGTIKDISVLSADVTGQWYVGNLVGTHYGTVSNSHSTGSVTGEGYIGGLVGGSGGIVRNSHSASSVTGDSHVGGLVGGNAGTVSNSYSTGNVTGDSHVGGLVGGNAGTVSNSYSTGSTIGNSHVGGLVGWNDGTVNNSFWDSETSVSVASAGGTGKTTAEMMDITTFTAAAWNITVVASGQTNTDYIWNIVNAMTYPFLSWQPV
jgi:hypothetical protein